MRLMSGTRLGIAIDHGTGRYTYWSGRKEDAPVFDSEHAREIFEGRVTETPEEGPWDEVDISSHRDSEKRLHSWVLRDDGTQYLSDDATFSEFFLTNTFGHKWR